jgi:hypothetical protein
MPSKRRKKVAVSKYVLFIAIFFFPSIIFGQTPTIDTVAQLNKKRLRNLAITTGAAYGITLMGLSQLWYKDSEKQSFRFFNDNAEWKQVDKLGHFFSAFYFSYGASRAMRWCNVPQKKSDLIGAVTGFAVLLPIEIMDGFSNAYGASSGDLLANAGGSAFFLGQSRLWNEVRIYPKFSFNRSGYAKYRPDVLGDGFPSEALKDYNGQTYWLSFDMDKFITFPKWLNVAVGYGADGMVYARDSQNISNGFGDSYRQVYLALDLDLSAFKTRSRFLNTLIMMANMLKFPAPAFEFSEKGTRVHAFMF